MTRGTHMEVNKKTIFKKREKHKTSRDRVTPRLLCNCHTSISLLSIFVSIRDSREADRGGGGVVVNAPSKRGDVLSKPCHAWWTSQKPLDRKEAVYQLFSISDKTSSTQACAEIMTIVGKIYKKTKKEKQLR